MKTHEILTAAADLIEPEGRWTQGENARLPEGGAVDPDNKHAACWCLEGALDKVAKGQNSHGAYDAVRSALGRTFIYDWNDAPDRTQAEVVAALRKAAEIARGGEA